MDGEKEQTIMTQDQAKLQAEINELANSFVIPPQEKVDKYMPKLEALITYYEEKVPDVPEKLGWTFTGYTYALRYAIDIMKMHKKLTKKLAELADDGDIK